VGSPAAVPWRRQDRVGWRDRKPGDLPRRELLVEFVEVSAVVQLAVRPRNDLYVLWTRATSCSSCSQSDAGRSWSAPLTVSPPGLPQHHAAALAAGPRGAIGSRTTRARTRPRSSSAATSRRPRRARAATAVLCRRGSTIRSLPIFQNYGTPTAPAPIHRRRYDASGTSGGFRGAARPPTAAQTIPTTGYVGHLAFPAQAQR